jgi:hypothetical protein
MESDDLSIRPVAERMEPVSNVPAAPGRALPGDGQEEQRRRPPPEPPWKPESEVNAEPDAEPDCESDREIQPHRLDNLA